VLEKTAWLIGWETQMRSVKTAFPIAVSVGLILAVTAVLWRLNSNGTGSGGLVYIYLLPVALIAAYSGYLALFCAATALFCADFFLQDPIYSLANDNPLEYGDLFCFAVLAAITIKFIRELLRPRPKILEAKSRYRWG
jgi:K+-sensing histidine kinase KdpD